MWKDNLREASFRGVPFFYDSTGIDGGRRTQTHEFAYRDKPYTEDLGRKAQEIPIEAYVLGDDYMTARDNLLKACNEEGPGELIHPYYGSIQVNCQVISIRESTSEGRIARISMTFIEAGEKFFPDSSPNRTAAVESSADTLDAAAADDFAGVFSVEGFPEFVSLFAIRDIIKFLNAIFGDQADINLISAFSSLIQTPRSLALSTQALLGGFNETQNDLKLKTIPAINIINLNKAILAPAETVKRKNYPSKTLIETCNYGNRISSTSKSTTQARINGNSNALIDLVRRSAISAASRSAVEAAFDTRNDAESVRDDIADAIDSQAEITSEIPIYLALTDMRAALVQAVPPEGLPELVAVNVKRPVSSLVLAYDLYADALRGDEIITRNNVRHPGFIGPADVQVVSEVVS